MLLAAAAASVSLNSSSSSSNSNSSDTTSSRGATTASPEGKKRPLGEKLQILHPHVYYKCIDERGANFRTQPLPHKLVGDGSGLDPGEIVRVCARTKNWLKVYTKNMDVVGSRWLPLFMYWGDKKQLFQVTRHNGPPATKPRNDVVDVQISLGQFNSLTFNTKSQFPVVVAFKNKQPEEDEEEEEEPPSTLKTVSEHVLKPGMALLAIGKWSLVRSKFATVAAMLNARPDKDTAVFAVSSIVGVYC